METIPAPATITGTGSAPRWRLIPYSLASGTSDINGTLADAVALNFSVTEDVNPVTLDTVISSPQPNEAMALPFTVIGTGSAPDGVDTVLVGIRDQVSNLRWNNGGWGTWLLSPATITPTNQAGTQVKWTTIFNPAGARVWSVSSLCLDQGQQWYIGRFYSSEFRRFLS